MLVSRIAAILPHNKLIVLALIYCVYFPCFISLIWLFLVNAFFVVIVVITAIAISAATTVFILDNVGY